MTRQTWPQRGSRRREQQALRPGSPPGRERGPQPRRSWSGPWFPKPAVFRLSHSQIAAPCSAHAEQLRVPIEAGRAHLHVCKMHIDGNAHVEIHPTPSPGRCIYKPLLAYKIGKYKTRKSKASLRSSPGALTSEASPCPPPIARLFRVPTQAQAPQGTGGPPGPGVGLISSLGPALVWTPAAPHLQPSLWAKRGDPASG